MVCWRVVGHSIRSRLSLKWLLSGADVVSRASLASSDRPAPPQPTFVINISFWFCSRSFGIAFPSFLLALDALSPHVHDLLRIIERSEKFIQRRNDENHRPTCPGLVRKPLCFDAGRLAKPKLVRLQEKCEPGDNPGDDENRSVAIGREFDSSQADTDILIIGEQVMSRKQTTETTRSRSGMPDLPVMSFTDGN